MFTKSNIYMSYVSDNLIKELFDIKNLFVDTDFEDNNDVITKNCKLSKNQIHKLSDNYKKEIAGPNFHYGCIHHLHILEFYKDSALDFHNHSKYEHFSFVIYMDNVGGTEFCLDKGSIIVPSEKTKIVWFPSELVHRAVTHGLPRVVAAGGIIRK